MKGGKKGGKRGGRRMRKAVKKYGQQDFARVIHTLQNELPITSTGNGQSGSPSQTYGLYNFSLNISPRAVQVAHGYQEYRISKIELRFKPSADTYESLGVSTGASPGLPYLYYLIDKTASLANAGTNTQTLKQAGAKPIRIDDRNVVIKWKPTVQVGSGDAGSPPGPAPVLELAAMYKTSPWITTNANADEPTASWAPNSVDHFGIVFGAESPRGPLGVVVGSVSITLTYEFRKPLWYTAPTAGVVMQRVNLEDLGKDVVQVEA